VLSDALFAWWAYTGLFVFRKLYIESGQASSLLEVSRDPRYLTGSIWVACFWCLLYYITEFYKDPYRRSRIKDLTNTLTGALSGSIIIFFALILDDFVQDYRDYYQSFLVYFGLHFIGTALGRTLITSFSAYRIKNRIIGFPTLIVGSNEKAVELYQELRTQKKSPGFQFVGFVSVNNNVRYLMEQDLKHLGEYPELNALIPEHGIEEVIIAIETKEHDKLERILNELRAHEQLRIHVIPDTYDILSGQVRLQSYGTPLVEIQHELMSVGQRLAKRIFDLLFALFAMVLLSPIMLLCALMVLFSSPGPIFFLQDRIGLNGRSFRIIKFRSMIANAEANGPQLSSENDSRITGWGRLMRKYRLDELPQIFNVLAGDMSVVGPRPERAFYIERIKESAPHFVHLQKVRPGITSWGMVKFGYAENVEEMVQRVKYDIIYIENINFLNDLKVLIYTVLIVLQGRGK
jgi:exopolysaccharide biosynthesis polyprenyl glycosylphosphotransferase